MVLKRNTIFKNAKIINKMSYDTSKCYVDVQRAKRSVLLVDEYPEFKEVTDFNNDQNDLYFRIVVLASDPKSPFMSIKDYKTQQQEILKFLGEDLAKPKTKALLETMCEFKEPLLTRMMYTYLMYIGADEYAAWISCKLAYYQLLDKQSKPLKEHYEDPLDLQRDMNTKISIGKFVSDAYAAMKKWESTIFENTKLKSLAIREEVKKLVTYPEKYSEPNSVS